ncbi:hypothetical protein ACRRTK_001829 [Alexandromys fortis]
MAFKLLRAGQNSEQPFYLSLLSLDALFFMQEGRETSAHQLLHGSLLPSSGWSFTTHSATELSFLPMILRHGGRWRLQDN